jgi:putative ABC transport system permease protein
MALPPEPNLLEPDIVEGRDLRAGDTAALVVNTALAARSPAFAVGRDVTVTMGPAPVTFTVVGVAREPFTPAAGYIPLAFFERHGHAGVANSLRLSLDRGDAAGVAAARAALDPRLAAAGVRVLGSSGTSDGRYAFDQHMLMIYVFLLVMAAVLAGVGGLGLTTTMSLNVMERRREMGVLRSVGATPARVWVIVAAEAAVVALLAWLLAMLLARPVGRALSDLLVRLMLRGQVAFVTAPWPAAAWLGISLLLGVLASVLPAWQASRRPVREAIAYE